MLVALSPLAVLVEDERAIDDRRVVQPEQVGALYLAVIRRRGDRVAQYDERFVRPRLRLERDRERHPCRSVAGSQIDCVLKRVDRLLELAALAQRATELRPRDGVRRVEP